MRYLRGRIKFKFKRYLPAKLHELLSNIYIQFLLGMSLWYILFLVLFSILFKDKN